LGWCYDYFAGGENMTILWCGGEDVDFPNGAAPVLVGDSKYFRSNTTARVALTSSTQNVPIKSTIFPSGGITSGWLTFRTWESTYANYKWAGFGRSGPNVWALCVGNSSSNALKLALWKLDGTTWTELSTETGASIGYTIGVKYDIQIIDYGSNATVNVYRNGALLITYTGSIAAVGVSNIDSVWAFGDLSGQWCISEIIVADEDTRIMQLDTIAPSAAGDTNSWTGSYTDIDETTLSDTDKLYTSTADADVQVNLTGMPAGSYTPLAVKLTTRFANPSTQYGLQQGVKTNGTVSLSATQQSVGYWGSKEVMYQTNPVTGQPWTSAEIEALQFAYRHKVIA
jgi:hypothetical protein